MKLVLPKKLHKTILLKLIIYFVLIIAITLLASTVFTYLYFSSYFKTEITRINQKVLNQMSVFSDNFILKNTNELSLNQLLDRSKSNYLNEFFKSGNPSSSTLLNVYDQLNNIVFQNRDIVDAIIVYSKDTELAVGTRFIKQINSDAYKGSSEFSWINTFLQSNKSLLWLKTRNTAVYSSSTQTRGNVISIICSYPFSSKGKDIKGLIAVNIKEKALNDFLVKFESLNSGQLIIIDNTGATISHSDETKLYEDISTEPFVKTILESKNSGDIESVYGGQNYVISYTPSSFNNWIYISMVPSEIFYQQDFILKKNLILISIIILLTVFMLSNIFSYKIYLPLRKVIDRYIPARLGIAHPGTNINEYKQLDNIFSNMSDKITDLQGTLDRNSQLIRHNFLMGLLTSHNTIPYNDEESLKFLNMTFQKRFFVVLVLNISKSGLIVNQSSAVLLYKYNIIEFIEALDKSGISSKPVDTDISTVSVIVNTDSDSHEDVKGFIADIKDYCLENFSFVPIIGIGRFYDDLGSVSKSNIEAKISIQNRFLYPEQNIFIYGDSPDMPSDTAATLHSFSEKIDKFLKLDDMNKLQDTLSNFTMFIIEKKIPYIQVKKEGLNITKLFKAYIADKSINLEDISANASLDRLRNTDNIYEFTETFQQYARIVHNYLFDKKLRKNSELVKSVKQYIMDNLQMEISLNSTAEAFHISSFYLSKIFKEETGFNYIDYVVECKMDKAKELLSTSSMGIDNITASVGYSHSTYFSRKFKEYTGKTPNEYRKEIHDKR